LNGHTTETANLRKRRILFFYVSYEILTHIHNSYVFLKQNTEIQLWMNGNVTLETRLQSVAQRGDWSPLFICHW